MWEVFVWTIFSLVEHASKPRLFFCYIYISNSAGTLHGCIQKISFLKWSNYTFSIFYIFFPQLNLTEIVKQNFIIDSVAQRFAINTLKNSMRLDFTIFSCLLALYMSMKKIWFQKKLVVAITKLKLIQWNYC